jgi:hypothetical protein
VCVLAMNRCMFLLPIGSSLCSRLRVLFFVCVGETLIYTGSLYEMTGLSRSEV